MNLQKSGNSAAETLIHFAGLVVTAEAEAAVVNPGVVRAAAAAAAAEAAEAACGAAAANENEKLQLVLNFVKPWTFMDFPLFHTQFFQHVSTRSSRLLNKQLFLGYSVGLLCHLNPFDLSVKIA